MNTNPPNMDPLDEDEQALARVVRALPAGEPPAAVDARILKAASDALATPTRRRAAWLSSAGSLWGIGSAAAAVLAIGIAWQRMYPPMPSLPATSPVPVPEQSRSDGGVPVEFKEETRPQYDNSPPPSTNADPGARQAKPMAAPPAPAEPTPFPGDRLDERVANAVGVSSNEPATGAAAARGETARASAAQMRAGDEMAKATSAERDQADTAIATDVTGRVATDESLYPESWLLKIRSRIEDGDIDGARASLRLFVAKYPSQSVPDDLKALLHE